MSTCLRLWSCVFESSLIGPKCALTNVWPRAIFLFGLVGCTNGDTVHDMSAEEFVSARGAAICDSLLTCPEQFHHVYPSDVALAMTERCADAVEAENDWFRALLLRGHTRADPREAERCLLAIATCSLAEPRCERALVGTLLGGEPCVDDEECSSGHCDGGSAMSCGQCSPASARAKVGETCLSSIDCEQPQGVEVQCLSDEKFRSSCTVVSTARVGESCASPGRVCEAGADCDLGGTCRLPVPARQACASSEHCAPGSLCANTADGRYCVPVTLQKQGEPCSGEDFERGDDGTFQRCDRTLDLRCDDATHTCVSLSRARSGESCDQRPCLKDLICDETQRCAAPRLVGQACRGGLECASHRCRGSVCVALEESACQ